MSFFEKTKASKKIDKWNKEFEEERKKPDFYLPPIDFKVRF